LTAKITPSLYGPVKFQWTINQGRILTGQWTPTVSVDTTGLASNVPLIATVYLDLPTQCYKSASHQVLLLATKTPHPKLLTEINLTVNGIRSGTSLTRVRALLGKPLQDKRAAFDDCAQGWHRSLVYVGLTLDFISNGKGRNYTVTKMEITSAKWKIAPGIRIGDTISKLRNTYGTPYKADNEVLMYVTKKQSGSS